MKICKIIGVQSKDIVENDPVILLCDHCYQADAKRGENAQIVSYDEYSSDYDVSCEVCYKTLKEEREEVA
jgi:hypothetical protein